MKDNCIKQTVKISAVLWSTIPLHLYTLYEAGLKNVTVFCIIRSHVQTVYEEKTIFLCLSFLCLFNTHSCKIVCSLCFHYILFFSPCSPVLLVYICIFFLYMLACVRMCCMRTCVCGMSISPLLVLEMNLHSNQLFIVSCIFTNDFLLRLGCSMFVEWRFCMCCTMCSREHVVCSASEWCTLCPLQKQVPRQPLQEDDIV